MKKIIRFLGLCVIMGFLLSSRVVHAAGAEGEAEELLDSIKIISITPNSFTFYEPTTFTVKVEYTLVSTDEAIIYLGFNTEYATSFSISGREGSSMVVSKGTGRLTLYDTVSPVDWSEPKRLAGYWLHGYTGSEIITDFMVYVNISEYPHANSWVPLATDEGKIVDLMEGDESIGLSPDLEIVRIDYETGSKNVEWGSALFDKDSTEFNWKLARLSSVLCAAAENNTDTNHLEEAEVQLLSNMYLEDEMIQTLFPFDQTTNIEKALLKLGFPEENISLYSYPHSRFNEFNAERNGVYYARDNDLAFAIASMPMETQSERINLVVIVIRGSKTLGEFTMDRVTSANHLFETHLVYDIVYEFEEDVRHALYDYMGEHEEQLEGRTKYLICGHSLGGATANLTAAWLTAYSSGSWAKKQDIYAYTFGAIDPMPYSGNVLNGFENIYNVFNLRDTFGPFGNTVITTNGNKMVNRYGHIYVFNRDYRDNALQYILDDVSATNHQIGNYVIAMVAKEKLTPFEEEAISRYNDLVKKVFKSFWMINKSDGG